MNHRPSVEVVVAHYNEDLSWLKEELGSCTIYSKGGKENVPPQPHIILPNIGREGHTYLHHIIERYSSLADITIFLQGRIDDHITLTPSEIMDAARGTKDGQVTTFPFRELELFDHWDGIPWDEYPCWKKWFGCASATRTPAKHWQRIFPGTKVPMSVAYQPGALFAVRRSTIQQHPLSLYKFLLEEFFSGDMAHINPETGHFMERFWLAIWNPSEYAIWHDDDIASEERNEQGQLARGRWHVVPKYKEVDERIFNSVNGQLHTPPPSDDE
ncbi:MAG: hypothetical protein M1836_005621 [Candelina mexicana]|nr:MAG: hypothetical protein M1836_005621 [Candelina mexicana]